MHLPVKRVVSQGACDLFRTGDRATTNVTRYEAREVAVLCEVLLLFVADAQGEPLVSSNSCAGTALRAQKNTSLAASPMARR